MTLGLPEIESSKKKPKIGLPTISNRKGMKLSFPSFNDKKTFKKRLRI